MYNTTKMTSATGELIREASLIIHLGDHLGLRRRFSYGFLQLLIQRMSISDKVLEPRKLSSLRKREVVSFLERVLILMYVGSEPLELLSVSRSSTPEKTNLPFGPQREQPQGP